MRRTQLYDLCRAAARINGHLRRRRAVLPLVPVHDGHLRGRGLRGRRAGKANRRGAHPRLALPMTPERLVVLALLGLSGCGTTRLASPEEDAAAKTFAQATAFVYWPEDGLRGERRAIVVDGRWWAEMSVGTFAELPLRPGPHTLHIADTDPGLDLRFTAPHAGNAFFAASLDGARVVGESSGKRAVLQSRLARTNDALSFAAGTWMPWFLLAVLSFRRI
jgi:hypothetical protein